MTIRRLLLCFLVILALTVRADADDANAAFKRGVHAESLNQYDAAYEAYKLAFALKPRDPAYLASYLQMRSTAAVEHVKVGQTLARNLKYQAALVEFQRAAEIDATNFVAAEEMRRVALLIKQQAAGSLTDGRANPAPDQGKRAENVEGPLELEPSPNSPISLRMTTTADNVYKTIGKLGGINVLFDLDYKPQKITVELNEVNLEEALKMVAMESKTFWRPISSTAIFVASDSKRKDLESNVMKTFYLQNSSGTADLQEVVGALKGMLDINRVQVNATHSSITMRGTQDQLVLAEKLISNYDRPKSEVVIDIAVLQVSRDRMRNMGTTVPTSTTVSPVTATGAAKIIQSPEIRALNDEKATLRIGDRVPIATGTYTSGIVGTANTQFQYLDVGVNIDITPHIHSVNEVTLKMSLEISTVASTVTIGGISQPVIGQRRIEHETRLQDGEVNLVGGILEDSETRSLGGYPWLARIPILGYLFGQTNKDRSQNEIIFAITPHIVRADEFTEENLRLIDVGTGANIGLRYKEPKKAAPSDVTSAPGTPASPSPKSQPSGAPQLPPAPPTAVKP